AVSRRTFHDRMVDRAGLLDRLVRGLEQHRRADHRAQRLQKTGESPERGGDRAAAPEEDPRIPRDPRLLEKHLRPLLRGLFLEPVELIRYEPVDIPLRVQFGDQIAVLGSWASCLDAEGD